MRIPSFRPATVPLTAERLLKPGTSAALGFGTKRCSKRRSREGLKTVYNWAKEAASIMHAVSRESSKERGVGTFCYICKRAGNGA